MKMSWMYFGQSQKYVLAILVIGLILLLKSRSKFENYRKNYLLYDSIAALSIFSLIDLTSLPILVPQFYIVFFSVMVIGLAGLHLHVKKILVRIIILLLLITHLFFRTTLEHPYRFTENYVGFLNFLATQPRKEPIICTGKRCAGIIKYAGILKIDVKFITKDLSNLKIESDNQIVITDMIWVWRYYCPALIETAVDFDQAKHFYFTTVSRDFSCKNNGKTNAHHLDSL